MISACRSCGGRLGVVTADGRAGCVNAHCNEVCVPVPAAAVYSRGWVKAELAALLLGRYAKQARVSRG